MQSNWSASAAYSAVIAQIERGPPYVARTRRRFTLYDRVPRACRTKYAKLVVNPNSLQSHVLSLDADGFLIALV